MELNKTRCLDCGHVNKWYSYKWADTPGRKEHNRLNSTTCPKCKSNNVEDFDDDETMEVYRFAADAIAKVIKDKQDSKE